jgi:Rap1a immunity proteins
MLWIVMKRGAQLALLHLAVALPLWFFGVSLANAESRASQVVHFDGEVLYDGCDHIDTPTDGAGMLKAGMCIGFVMGVVDLLAAQAAIGEPSGICAPEAETSEQYVAVVTKYLREHPEMQREKAIIVVSGALYDAFPCSRQSSD